MKRIPLILPAFLLLVQAAFSSWRWDDPQPQGQALFAAAVSGGANPTIVAVGELGTVIRRAGSSDAWSSVGPVAGGASLSGVVWSGSRFLASGLSAGLWESADGVSWTQGNAAVQASYLLRTGGKIFALGGSRIWVSSGGAFAEQSLEAAGIVSYRGVAAGPTGILLYGSAGLLTTTSDGIAWRRSTQPENVAFLAAAGGSEGFLVGGVGAAGAGILLLSADGTTWSPLSLPSGRFIPSRNLRLPAGWLVQDYWTGNMFRSADSAPAQWTSVDSGLSGFLPAAAVALSDDRVLFFGDRGLVAALQGALFVPQIAGGINTAFLYAPRFSAAAAGGLLAAIDRNVSDDRLVRYFRGLSSPAGVTWTQPSPAPVRGLVALAPAGDNEIVGYSAGAAPDAAGGLPSTLEGFYRTSDGLAWRAFGRVNDPETDRPLLDGRVVSFAARPDESAVVVLTRSDVSTPDGYAAVRGIYRTTDWTTWEQSTLPAFRTQAPASEETMESVSWDGSQFILLLYPGRVFTSPDGLSWKQLPPLPAGLAAVSAASGGGAVVVRTAALLADGTYGPESSGGEKICVFQDGRWWPRDTGRRTPVLQRSVIRAGGVFVATGRGAEVLVSADGFAWSGHTSPGAPVSLLWNGARLAAFNDSFAAFSYEGIPSGGTPLGLASVAPRSRSVAAPGESYTLDLDLAVGAPWSVSKVPSWMTVSPLSGTGPAQLSVVISPNTGKTPRGATLLVAGESHLVFQNSPGPLLVPSLGGPGQSLKFPFSGDWSIFVPPGAVSAPASTGSGAIPLVFARNDSTEPREIVININGTDYTIPQQGTPLSFQRAGSYAGLVGFLSEGASSSLLDDYTAAFEGSLRVVVAPPGKQSADGSYSAQLTFHDGTKPLVYRGSGALSADGTVTNARWSAGPKGPHLTIKSMSVVRDEFGRRYLHGEFENAGFRFGLLAGRNVFAAKTDPLTPEYAGRSTFFLTKFGEGGISADTGAGSASIGPDGVARIAGTLAGGGKFTASSSLWGAFEPQLVMPFAFSAGPGRLVCGFSRYDTAAAYTDWDGLAALVAPGFNADAGRPQTEMAYLSASLCLYTPPAKGASAFNWSGGAVFRLESESSGGLDAEVFSPSPGKISVQPIEAPGAKVAVSFDARSGMIKGSFVPGKGAKPVKMVGALTRKQSNIQGDVGGFLGLLLENPPGRFEISPP